MNQTRAHEVLLDAFEETALVLGGIFAVHDVEDEAVWQAMKSLSVIYRKAREALRSACDAPSQGPAEKTPEPHPAVVELLAQLRRDRRPAAPEEVGSPCP